MSDIIKQESVDTQTIIDYLDSMGLVNKLSEKEKRSFIEIATAFKLNPFKREIYVNKYGDNMSIIVGYESYIKRAERTLLLDGWEVTTEGSIKNGDLKAIITIYRKDRKFAFKHEVFYSEYVQFTKEGRPTKFWADKPYTMIKKVVMAQGFRLCFSDELGGMPYTSEEINDNKTQNYAEINPVLMISDDQKIRINLLLDSDYLDDQAKSFVKNIESYTFDRANKCIDFLTAKIEETKFKEENDPKPIDIPGSEQ